jgi:hypothetical protein
MIAVDAHADPASFAAVVRGKSNTTLPRILFLFYPISRAQNKIQTRFYPACPSPDGNHVCISINHGRARLAHKTKSVPALSCQLGHGERQPCVRHQICTIKQRHHNWQQHKLVIAADHCTPFTRSKNKPLLINNLLQHSQYIECMSVRHWNTRVALPIT